MAVALDLSLTLKAKFFRGLADPSRLNLLEALRDGPRTVSALVAQTGLTHPNASGHLACLKDCGLVTSRQDGRYVTYALADPRIETVLRGAEGVLADIAAQVYACTRYEETR